MAQNKISGVLLPVSSLPGKYGIGQIGKSAYNFIDFLADSGFSYWEILPLCPTNISNSPYQGTSVFGLNTYLIDYDLLIEEGLLNSRDFQGIDFGKDTRNVDYTKVFINSRQLLYKAFKRFDKNNKEFQDFCINKYFHDFAIYSALKELNDYKAWFDWRLEDRVYEPEVENELMSNHSDLYYYYIFTQFMFVKQWKKLKEYAAKKNIKILGQIAHFIGYDSDEVYLHSERFLLDKLGRMTLVAGFPPDEFSKDGQKWGEPLYDWNYMRSNHYKWWKKRIDVALYLFDSVMINHFSGFYKTYGVPFRAKNAKKGEYVYASGKDVLDQYKGQAIVASDLGNKDENITNYIKELGFCNVYTARLGLLKNRQDYDYFLPSNVPEISILYFGNHDNRPIRGDIENLDSEHRKILTERLVTESVKLGINPDFNTNSTREIFNKCVEVVGYSKARYVTYTMQDILYQSIESRTNYPGIMNLKENWTYRFLQSDITKLVKDKWKKLNIATNRFNCK